MKQIVEVIQLIDRAIDSDPENTITSWWIIAFWYDAKVDEYRSTIQKSKDWLASYQTDLVKKSWIQNLKMKYTWVSWYFIEVPKSQATKAPDFFIHKQTLVNASRFVTAELLEFQSHLSEAEEHLSGREYQIFLEIREEILGSFASIQSLSSKISFLDFTATLWHLAYQYNYCRPIIWEWYDMSIEWWRHPVIERTQKDFISNSLTLSKKDFVHIITWPNMWWKSTFLRQNALVVLLAHIGSFVPAENASIPIIDKLFSRVWASDNLFLGQSTFMVEMQEVAYILNNSTSKSFVIIDEVGRWTSTYDGMSIAWAILKENHDSIRAKTLFATHYHELIDESESLKWVENFSIAVWEENNELVFLRKVIRGWVKKSFWLEVARMAWVWVNVIQEAKNMLLKLESEHRQVFGTQLTMLEASSYEEEKESELEKELEDLDVNNITPLEALELLVKIKSNIWKK